MESLDPMAEDAPPSEELLASGLLTLGPYDSTNDAACSTELAKHLSSIAESLKCLPRLVAILETMQSTLQRAPGRSPRQSTITKKDSPKVKKKKQNSTTSVDPSSSASLSSPANFSSFPVGSVFPSSVSSDNSPFSPPLVLNSPLAPLYYPLQDNDSAMPANTFGSSSSSDSSSSSSSSFNLSSLTAVSSADTLSQDSTLPVSAAAPLSLSLSPSASPSSSPRYSLSASPSSSPSSPSFAAATATSSSSSSSSRSQLSFTDQEIIDRALADFNRAQWDPTQLARVNAWIYKKRERIESLWKAKGMDVSRLSHYNKVEALGEVIIHIKHHEYPVEKILEKHTNGGEIRYLCKFEGWDVMWQSEEDLLTEDQVYSTEGGREALEDFISISQGLSSTESTSNVSSRGRKRKRKVPRVLVFGRETEETLEEGTF